MPIFESLGAYSTILAGIILVMANRRVILLIGLLVQYAAVVLLTVSTLGVQISLVKLVAGSLSTAILWLSLREKMDYSLKAGGDLIDRGFFRVGLLILVLAAGWGLGRAAWLNIPTLNPSAEIGATMLLVLGLMLAGFFDEPLRVGIGIMTCVSGFEIIYAAVEPSLAVISLLAGVQLSLALVTGYLSQIESTRRGEPA